MSDSIFVYSEGVCSNISPGWQFSTSHILFSVENLTALTLPVFKFDKLAILTSTFSLNSLNCIFRSASTRSKRTMIGMVKLSYRYLLEVMHHIQTHKQELELVYP